ncbi:MAG: hypothetical protein AAFZ38_02830 [Myxococcota bacterium]
MANSLKPAGLTDPSLPSLDLGQASEAIVPVAEPSLDRMSPRREPLRINTLPSPGPADGLQTALRRGQGWMRTVERLQQRGSVGSVGLSVGPASIGFDGGVFAALEGVIESYGKAYEAALQGAVSGLDAAQRREMLSAGLAFALSEHARYARQAQVGVVNPRMVESFARMSTRLEARRERGEIAADDPRFEQVRSRVLRLTGPLQRPEVRAFSEASRALDDSQFGETDHDRIAAIERLTLAGVVEASRRSIALLPEGVLQALLREHHSLQSLLDAERAVIETLETISERT